MPTQGTTTKDPNQRCTDVAFHSEGTRPSWQTSLLPGSFDHLICIWTYLKLIGYGRNVMITIKKYAESNMTPSHG